MKHNTYTAEIDGKEFEIPENEALRSITINRLRAFADAEEDSDERDLLNNLSDWLQQVKFVQE